MPYKPPQARTPPGGALFPPLPEVWPRARGRTTTSLRSALSASSSLPAPLRAPLRSSSGTFCLPMRLAACTRALCAPSAPNRHAARCPPAAATAGPLPHRRRAGGNRCPPRLVSARPAVAAAASAAAVAVQPASDALVVSTDFLVRDIARGAVAAASGLCVLRAGGRSCGSRRFRARRCLAAASLASRMRSTWRSTAASRS